MNAGQLEAAARRLAEAGSGHRHIESLPDDAHPASVEEAHAIQQLAASLSAATIAGWKVATDAEGQAMWGAIYERDLFASPAAVEATRMPLRGVEGEIAFRFTRDLAARREPYSRAEIRAVLTAVPAIEIVDSRFESYEKAPMLDRLADRMSNGGLVVGAAELGADGLDLSNLHVVLTCDGETLVDQSGGHNRGDPLLPVIDFIHARQASLGFSSGQIITAGTLTGVVFGRPGQRYEVRFDGVGAVGLSFI